MAHIRQSRPDFQVKVLSTFYAVPSSLESGLAGRGEAGPRVTEAGSYLRLIDSCITQLKAQGPSGTCNESKEEEEGPRVVLDVRLEGGEGLGLLLI